TTRAEMAFRESPMVMIPTVSLGSKAIRESRRDDASRVMAPQLRRMPQRPWEEPAWLVAALEARRNPRKFRTALDAAFQMAADPRLPSGWSATRKLNSCGSVSRVIESSSNSGGNHGPARDRTAQPHYDQRRRP